MPQHVSAPAAQLARAVVITLAGLLCYTAFLRYERPLQPKHDAARALLLGALRQAAGLNSSASAGALPGASPEGLLAFYRQQQLSSQRQRRLVDWVSTGARAAFCGCFAVKPGEQAALVGNGPLSAEQRQRIAAAHCVVRFNRLNNWEPGERTDVIIVRGGPRGRTPFHMEGLQGFLRGRESQPEAMRLYREVARGARSIVLAHVFRPQPGAAAPPPEEPLQPGYPWTEGVAGVARFLGLSAAQGAAKLNLLDLGALNAFWRGMGERLRGTNSIPSTGMLGILASLECLPPNATLEVYGFNWSEDNSPVHSMGLEKSLLQAIAGGALDKRLVLHPTPCSGRHTCPVAQAGAPAVADPG